MRSFIAFEINQEIKDKLVELRGSGVVQGQSLRWVKPELMHFTLKFLGEIPSNMVINVTEAIKNASKDFKPFDLQVKGLGFFPNFRRPRVFWAGVKDLSGTLKLLHEKIDGALSGLGFDPEKRSFKPHLTLARFKGQGGSQTLDEARRQQEFGFQTVKEIVLFKSDLRPQGPIYSRLGAIGLEE